MSLINDIEILIQKTTEFMLEKKLKDLTGSIRKGVWRDLCLKINNVENFNEQSRLNFLWFKRNSNFKQKVLNNISISENSRKQHIVKFSVIEWDKLIEEATNPNKVKFLVDFDNILSEKLQQQGFKCWLRCSNNYLGKKAFWTGKFFCIEKACGMLFDAFALKQEETIDIYVSFENKAINHSVIVKQLRVSGENRISQQKSLMANGICNTQSFNEIYNAGITDPSNT